MKCISRSLAALSALMALSAASSAAPEPSWDASEGAERTLAPCFFVKGDPDDGDTMPLKATSVEATVAGVIADVKVRQIYENNGAAPIEAVYVFPGSTRAAVHGLTMTIGERVIRAQVRERQEARAAYETAKGAGKSSSLLEQQRPNVFQMNVANILPGDRIEVELCYTEVIEPEEGLYEFVFPTVVGPRYSNRAAEGAAPQSRWVANPYLRSGADNPSTFDLKVKLATGLPVQDVACDTHQTDIAFDDPATARISLAAAERAGNNRDFILRYRLAGGKVQEGLLLQKGEKENTFLLMLQPPVRVAQAQIPPREYLFIVDVSGSMRGFPLEVSKKLLADLIGSLNPTDLFNVLLFAGSSSCLAEQSLPGTPENLRRALGLIDSQDGGGGTELLPALKRAMALPKAEGFSRSVVIATDGYVECEPEAFELIQQHLGQANLWAFGIGSAVNRHLIEGLARVGFGEAFVVTRPDEAPTIARRFREYVSTPVLTGIKIAAEGFDVRDAIPATVPDLFAQRPVLVFGKWHGASKGRLVVTGTSGEGPFRKVVDVAASPVATDLHALRYLWARHKIAELGDFQNLRYGDERMREITTLGLTYNLLTAHTSFIAVDEVIRNTQAPATTVKQPLPLPQGVSHHAVGGVPTSPEPETWAMLLVALSILGWTQRKATGRRLAIAPPKGGR
ncbi:MAG: VWA domain-containing protein [Verrucomicrobiae bacterium]|nr:VWA domain-containing protein [Verrucomicrobiae bacterium]